MKVLGLLRHAKSDWGASDKRDFDRGLNDRGRRGAALIGAHVRDYGMRWDTLLASPAERVKQTLASATIGLEPRYDERLYLASTESIFDVLRGAAGDRVLVAGHNPGLGEMVHELVAPTAENALFDAAKAKFPTAAFAVFDLAIDNWSDVRSGVGKLVHFVRPRDLDPSLGPEY